MQQREAFKELIELWEERISRGWNEHLLSEPSLELNHIKDMYKHIEDNNNPQRPGEAFGEAKLGRWLGWAQAAFVANGLGDLEDMKELNRKYAASA